MKHYLALMVALALLWPAAASAQTKKGTLYVGVGLTNLSIAQPKNRLVIAGDLSMGRFVADNLLVGGRLGIGFSQQTIFAEPYDFRSFGLSGSGFVRYYIPITERIKIPIEASLGMGGGTATFGETRFGSLYGVASLGTGVSFFLNKHMSIDPMISYNLYGMQSEGQPFRIAGHVQAKLGLSFYLGQSKPKKFQ